MYTRPIENFLFYIIKTKALLFLIVAIRFIDRSLLKITQRDAALKILFSSSMEYNTQ